MTKRLPFNLFVILSLSVFPLSMFAQERQLTVTEVKNATGTVVATFGPSYALVIGESAYTNGWPSLAGVKDDVVAVKKLFEEQNFTVRTLQDVNSKDLTDGISRFFSDYGYDKDSRLLIYFAGHGATRPLGSENRDMGYIVPTDAPSYYADDIGFKRKAIPMQQFDTWARQVESRHVIFLFDSCFSGSIFATTRALPGIIDYKIANPVRQFISSGGANETVPDKSVFRRQLESALRLGEGDVNKDGYVSASELGDFLQTTVVNYSNGTQHPQYGKIRDADLDKGDFVFLAGKPVVPQVVIAPVVGGSIDTTNQDHNNPTLSPGTAELYVISTPSDADLYIDGVLAGKTGNLIPNIAAGRTIKLEVRKGNQVARTELSLKGGELKELNMTLAALKGNLILKAVGAEACRLTLAGRDLGPLGGGLFRDLEAGDWPAVLRGDGLLWSGTVTVQAEKTNQVTAAPWEIGILDITAPADAVIRVLKNGALAYSRSGGVRIEDVPAGAYGLEASGSGYDPVSTTLAVTRGQTSRWQPWTTGSLTITTEPSRAMVYVNGGFVGQSPITVRSLGVGTATVSAKLDAYLDASAPATINAGKTAALSLVLSAAPKIPSNMVLVPGGTFTMGSPTSEVSRYSNEGPQRQVTVSAFYLGKYEVTFAEYDAFCDATKRTKPNDSGWGRESRPVMNVSWNDAVEYCNWRSGQDGLRPAYRINGTEVACDWSANGYRLPTEAEWEYACRAGTVTPFSTGSNITTSQANYDGNYPYNNNAKGESRQKTLSVGSFAANAWGLYDMHGNVWEWCWDWYADKYESVAATNPRGAPSGDSRVIRGGSWVNIGLNLRSAYRDWHDPTIRYDYLGFRLLRPSSS